MDRFKHLRLKVDFGIADVFIILFAFVLIYFLIYFFYFNQIKSKEVKKYFYPALTVKLIGSLFFAFIYTFYYRYGDTFIYFDGIKMLNKALIEDPVKWITIMLQGAREFNPSTFEYTSKIVFFRESSSFTLVKIGTLLNLISFNNFFLLTMVFACVSFFGVWYLFLGFYTLYPQLKNKLAFSILFFPSIVFWGSGILKDTIVLAGLGIFFYCFIRLFILKSTKVKYIIAAVVCAYVISTLKIYVMISISMAIVVYFIWKQRSYIKDSLVKVLTFPFVILTSSAFLIVIVWQFGSYDERYAISNILETASVYQRSHLAEVEFSQGGQGSSYNLGIFEPTFTGIIMKFPAAVNVTLFRPYLWEIQNFVMLLAGLESTFLLWLTITIIIKVKPLNFLRIAYTDPLVLLCLFFAVSFAFAIGFSTYNFGSLVRYKIPCIPFYLVSLYLIELISQKKDLSRKKIRYGQHGKAYRL